MSEESKASEKKDSKLTLSTVLSITTLSVPALYLIGFFYDVGYLSSYGLNYEHFPREVHEYLIRAFFSKLYLIGELAKNNIPQWIALFALIGVFLYHLLATYGNSKKDKISEKVESTKKHSWYKWLLKPAILATIGSLLSLYIFYILIIILLLLTFSIGIGKDQASKEIKVNNKCILESKPKEYPCTFLIKNNKVILSGLLIARSSSQIALWDGEQTIVEPLKDYRIKVNRAEVSH